MCRDETHSKHFIASICKTSHRSKHQLKRKTNISFDEILLNQYQQLSIYSVRCQKISFRRTVRIRALTEPWNCTLLDEKGKKQYSIHFTYADKDMEKLQCYLGTFYISIPGWLKREHTFFAQLLTLFCFSHDVLLVLQCSCSAESCWNSYQSAGDKAHTGQICSNNEEPSKPRIPPPPLHNTNNIIIKTIHLQLKPHLPPLQPLSCCTWPWGAPHSSVQCHGSEGGGRFSNGVFELPQINISSKHYRLIFTQSSGWRAGRGWSPMRARPTSAGGQQRELGLGVDSKEAHLCGWVTLSIWFWLQLRGLCHQLHCKCRR